MCLKLQVTQEIHFEFSLRRWQILKNGNKSEDLQSKLIVWIVKSHRILISLFSSPIIFAVKPGLLEGEKINVVEIH